MHSSIILPSFLAMLTFALAVNAAGPRPQCNEQYTPKSDETCDTIEAWSGINSSQIQTFNPNVTCAGTVGTNTLCLGMVTLNCTLNATASETTCSTLASNNNLTTAGFVQLNDDVNDNCNDLTVGNPYCISTAYCYPGRVDPMCGGDVSG